MVKPGAESAMLLYPHCITFCSAVATVNSERPPAGPRGPLKIGLHPSSALPMAAGRLSHGGYALGGSGEPTAVRHIEFEG